MATTRGKKLLIVESPAKARTIGQYLGSEYEVLASVGHIRDLPKSNKDAVDIENDFKAAVDQVRGLMFVERFAAEVDARLDHLQQ